MTKLVQARARSLGCRKACSTEVDWQDEGEETRYLRDDADERHLVAKVCNRLCVAEYVALMMIGKPSRAAEEESVEACGEYEEARELHTVRSCLQSIPRASVEKTEVVIWGGLPPGLQHLPSQNVVLELAFRGKGGGDNTGYPRREEESGEGLGSKLWC